MKIYEIAVEELGTTDCNIQDLVDAKMEGKEHLFRRDRLQEKLLAKALAIGIHSMMKNGVPINKETALMKLESLKKFIEGK